MWLIEINYQYTCLARNDTLIMTEPHEFHHPANGSLSHYQMYRYSVAAYYLRMNRGLSTDGDFTGLYDDPITSNNYQGLTQRYTDPITSKELRLWDNVCS